MTRAASQALEEGLTCPRCAELNAWDSRVCLECGTRLVVDNSVEAGDK